MDEQASVTVVSEECNPEPEWEKDSRHLQVLIANYYSAYHDLDRFLTSRPVLRSALRSLSGLPQRPIA